MEVVNAIAKVRFASAKPQRVHLRDEGPLQADLLCMEPSQQVTVRTGHWFYYVLTGTARVAAGSAANDVPAGQTALCEAGEVHTISNPIEQRLVCLAVGHSE